MGADIYLKSGQISVDHLDFEYHFA